MTEKLKFDISKFYERAKRLKKNVGLNGVTINLPFISLDFSANNNEKKIAREIIIRVRDKRVLNSKECCDSCIENALKSLSEVRQFLVDKQVEVDNIESSLFLLIDFALYGIRQFLTFTEFYNPHKNRENYFEALDTIRGHLLLTFDEIGKIAELPEKFGYRYNTMTTWDTKTYVLTDTVNKQLKTK